MFGNRDLALENMKPQHQALKTLCDNDLRLVLHNYHYVQGVIFAVAAAPEIPMPDQWFMWTFKAHGQLSGPKQADHLADVLMANLKLQLADMRVDTVSFPEDFELEQLNDRDLPVSCWLRGLLAAHTQLETVWQSAWQHVAQRDDSKLPAMQKDLRHCLQMFTTFADIPFALEQAQMQGNHELASHLPKIFESLPQSLQTYVTLSGALVEFLPDQFETFVQN